MVIVLVVLVIGYLVLAYFATRTWHVWHVVLVTGIFFGSILFAFLAASTLKTQMKFRGQYVKAAEDVERERQLQQRLLEGDQIGGEDAQPGLRTLEATVKRNLVDRGRVWKNLFLTDAAEVDGQKTITLNTSRWGDPLEELGATSEDDFADDTTDESDAGDNSGQPTSAPLGIEPGAVVFAFHDAPVKSLAPELQTILLGGDSTLLEKDETGLVRVPNVFLGEFQIKEIAPDNSSVTLTPTRELTEKEAGLLLQSDVPWVLYEVMPQDRHDIFAGLSAEQIRALLPLADSGLDDQIVAQLIREYEKDQQKAEPADDPARKYVKVIFKAPYSVVVNVQEPVPEPDWPFDPTGRAQSAILQQEEDETKFKKGDEAIFDFETAQQLERDGIVSLGETIYVRQLRNYESAFRADHFAISDLALEIQNANDELKALKNSIANLQEQIAFRTDERQKLIGDKAGFDYELQVVSELREKLSRKWQAVKSELSRLYRANRQLAQKAADFQTLPSSTSP